MQRLTVFLLISWAYVGWAGCGGGATSAMRSAVERPRLEGGPVRVALERPAVARDILAWNVGRSLAAREAVATDVPNHCSRFRYDPPARYPDGQALLPQDLIVEIERRLKDPASDARWLLTGVEGAADLVAGRAPSVSGLRAVEAQLEICTDTPAPDLVDRLEHPSLRHRLSDAPGLQFGPGPFVESAPGVLGANPAATVSRPFVERVSFVVAPDAALLLELGEADLALLYGARARQLRSAAGGSLAFERAPAWDRRFVLWLNPLARWINDPRFRRYLSGRVERGALLDYLFDSQGEVAVDLLDRPDAVRIEPVLERPVSKQSVPRFALAFAVDDRAAEAIAARIKATLHARRIEVTLTPLAADDLARRMREGRLQAAVLAAEPYFDEPLLRLRETAFRLGVSAADANLVLDQAAALASPEARDAAALAAQEILLQDALVIPLVKLHAWLARRKDLVGVRVGPRRMLEFDQAGWRR